MKVQVCHEDKNYLYIQTKDQLQHIEKFASIEKDKLKLIENPKPGIIYLTETIVDKDILRIKYLTENDLMKKQAILIDFGEKISSDVCYLRKNASNIDLKTMHSQCFAVEIKNLKNTIYDALDGLTDWVEVQIKPTNDQTENGFKIVELDFENKTDDEESESIKSSKSQAESSVSLEEVEEDVTIENINQICKIPLSNGKCIDFTGMFHFEEDHPIIEAEWIYNYLLNKKVNLVYENNKLIDADLVVESENENTEIKPLFKTLAYHSTVPINIKDSRVLKLLKR